MTSPIARVENLERSVFVGTIDLAEALKAARGVPPSPERAAILATERQDFANVLGRRLAAARARMAALTCEERLTAQGARASSPGTVAVSKPDERP